MARRDSPSPTYSDPNGRRRSCPLPFKLIFFVLVDGWFLVAGALVQSFGST